MNTVLLVDPSLFTYPHDSRFALALSGLYDVELIGRKLRPDELTKLKDGYPVHPLFYPLSERLRGAIGSTRVTIWLKVFEHALGMFKLARLVKKRKPKIVHFQWLAVPLIDRIFLKIIKRHCPIYLTLHDLEPFNGSPTSKLQLLGLNSALGEFNGILVHTEAGLDHIRKFVPDNVKLCRVDIPPDIEDVTKVLSKFNRDLDIPRSHFNLLITGYIKQYKGIDIAIKALDLLDSEIREKVQLIVAGEPKMAMDHLVSIQRTIRHPEKIKWILKYLSSQEMLSIMSEADIFLFPYREIQGSGVFSQALRFQKPVIATNKGIFSETIRSTSCGILIEAEPKALANAISELVVDPKKYQICEQGAVEANKALPSWRDVAISAEAFYLK